MLRIGFDGSDARAIAAFRAKGPQLVAAIKLKLAALMFRLQGHVVADKLQGQVLHHRSGKLSASIRVVPTTQQGDSLLAGVEGAGGPAWYGRIHEYGGNFTATRKLKHPPHMVRGRLTGTPYSLNFPQRSFMRTSQDDMRAQIVAELQDTVKMVLSE